MPLQCASVGGNVWNPSVGKGPFISQPTSEAWASKGLLGGSGQTALRSTDSVYIEASSRRLGLHVQPGAGFLGLLVPSLEAPTFCCPLSRCGGTVLTFPLSLVVTSHLPRGRIRRGETGHTWADSLAVRSAMRCGPATVLSSFSQSHWIWCLVSGGALARLPACVLGSSSCCTHPPHLQADGPPHPPSLP